MEGSITRNDVLCGRGGLTNSHVGNKLFRQIVEGCRYEYLQARKMEKRTIAKRIVAQINNNGGRFLKNTPGNAYWTEISEQKAVTKTSQALREGLDVKNNTVRPSKLYTDVNALDGSTTNKNPRRKRRSRLVEGLVAISSPNNRNGKKYITNGSSSNALYREALESAAAAFRIEEADDDDVPELVQSEDAGDVVPELVQSMSAEEEGCGYGVPPEFLRGGQSSTSLTGVFEPIFTFPEY